MFTNSIFSNRHSDCGSRGPFWHSFYSLLLLIGLCVAPVSWAERYQAAIMAPGSSGTAGEMRNVVLAFDDHWNYLTADFTILPSVTGGLANGFWMTVTPANATGNAARTLALYADLSSNRLTLYRLGNDPLDFSVDRNKDFLSSHADAVRMSDDPASGHRRIRLSVPLAVENGLGRFGASGVSWNTQLLLDARFSYDANHRLVGLKSDGWSEAKVQAQPVALLNSSANEPKLIAAKESPLWMLLFVLGLGMLIWAWRHPRYRRHVRQTEQRAAAAAVKAAEARLTIASVDAVETDPSIAGQKQ